MAIEVKYKEVMRKTKGKDGEDDGFCKVKVIVGYRAKPYWKGKALAGHSKTFPTRAKAKAHIDSVLTKIREGNLIDRKKSESVTLRQALDEYWTDIGQCKNSADSIKYRIDALKLTPLASLPLSAIKTSGILKLQSDLLKTKSPSTVINDMSPISACIKYAMVKHDLPYLINPCDAVKAPSVAGNARTRRLSKDERKSLLYACYTSGNKYLLEVVRLAVELGLRQDKLVSLKWGQVDFKSKVVRYGLSAGTSNKGVPPFAPFTKRMERIFIRIHKRTGGGEYVFPTTKNAIRLAFDKAKKSANIEDFRFHDLRHEAISRMFDEGLEVVHIMLFTGIKSAQTLKRYAQPRDAAMVALRYK